MRNKSLIMAVIVTVAGMNVDAALTYDEMTGSIRSLSSNGLSIVDEFGCDYFVMSKEGDVTGHECADVVVARQRSANGREYVCTNALLPGIEIKKSYRKSNAGLRRTLTFVNKNDKSRYVTPFVTTHFSRSFQPGLWHLGAGYIGPYKPFPNVVEPRPVNEYRQSSKGLVFIHPVGSKVGFSHYRVKIDDTVVLPWFHSTIGHYREYHDRLWYLPDGYKMGLGTFGLYKDRPVSVTDQFNTFEGDLFTFFDDIFGKDPDIAAEMSAIPPAPEWIQNLACIYWNMVHDDYVRWMGEMMDQCEFLACACLFNSWGDYRFDPKTKVLQGNFGGHLTCEETREYYRHLKGLCARLHADCYQNVVSAGKWTRVLNEHSDWFRRFDREGNIDSLFPNWSYTFQTMFSNPACQDWMVNMLASFARDTESDVCYTDETQMTNTIDWNNDRVTRDDGCVRFWQKLKKRLHADGTMYFANGSGLPYVDLNYMESPHEMQPGRWRDWVGVALGIGMMNRLKPGNRTSPLYWLDDCDYLNRFLALGWVPVPPERESCLMPVRASWQCGHMDPVNVTYSPDWKSDEETQIESHAGKRYKCGDIILSFINRGECCDVPVSIDLGSLRFLPYDQINIWRGHFNPDVALTGPKLSDRELRDNWRQEGSIDGASLYRPELVYSGPASGVFKDVITGLGRDKMEQYLIVSAPIQFYALDDIPLNLYYTTGRKARTEGCVVRNEVRADILLADLRYGFSRVMANDKPVSTKKVCIGRHVFDLITLEPGEWKISWKNAKRDAISATASLPSARRERRSCVERLRGATKIPEMRVSEKCKRRLDGAEIDEVYRWTTECETKTGVLRELHPGIANVDLDQLKMTAGASRREAVNTSTLCCWTGVRMHNVRKLSLRFGHSLQDTHASHLGYTYPWGWGVPAELFTGFVVDYHTKDGYVKRVSMSTGLFSDRSVAVFPWWGAAKNAPEVVNLLFGEWIEDAISREFSIDLSKFAPGGWDGETIFSLGENKLGAGRHLEVEILGFNEHARAEEITPRFVENIRDMPPPVISTPLKAKPRSLERLYSEEWDRWTKLPGKFTRLVSGVAEKGSVCYLAHDYEFIYVGVKCDEDDRGPAVGGTAPERNEHVEICVHRGDGKVIQYIGDAKGQVSCYVDNIEVAVPRGTVCRGENCKDWHEGWRVFFAIPLDSLKPNMQRTPVVIRANVCRERKLDRPEFTSWAPMEKNGVYDVQKYGTWTFDFNW